MNVTTRKRRSRKGVKWINHFYSDWYRKRLALGNIHAALIASQALTQINCIKSARIDKAKSQKDKAYAIAQCVVNANIAMLKARTIFIEEIE